MCHRHRRRGGMRHRRRWRTPFHRRQRPRAPSPRIALRVPRPPAIRRCTPVSRRGQSSRRHRPIQRRMKEHRAPTRCLTPSHSPARGRAATARRRSRHRRRHDAPSRNARPAGDPRMPRDPHRVSARTPVYMRARTIPGPHSATRARLIERRMRHPSRRSNGWNDCGRQQLPRHRLRPNRPKRRKCLHRSRSTADRVTSLPLRSQSLVRPSGAYHP